MVVQIGQGNDKARLAIGIDLCLRHIQRGLMIHIIERMLAKIRELDGPETGLAGYFDLDELRVPSTKAWR